MLFDWHAHYPMQVVEELTPRSAVERMRRVGGRTTLGDRARALLLAVLSRLFSDKDWWSGYRISVEGMRAANVGNVEDGPVFRCAGFPSCSLSGVAIFATMIALRQPPRPNLARHQA